MVEQIRQPLFTRMADGSIRNTYEIKLNNKLTAPMTVGVRIEGLAGATLDMDGMERIDLAPQERLKLLARIQVPPVAVKDDDADGKTEKRENEKDDMERAKVTFIVEALEGAAAEPIRRKVPFYRPDND